MSLMRTVTGKRIGYVSVGLLGALVTLWLSFRDVSPTAAPVPAPAVDTRAAVPHSMPPSSVSERVQPPKPGVRGDYIVQATTMALARRAVEEVGGVVTGEL